MTTQAAQRWQALSTVTTAMAVIDNDGLFYLAMKEAAAAGITATDLSAGLPVDKITAQRWIDGEAAPRPTMRPAVYRLIEGMLGTA